MGDSQAASFPGVLGNAGLKEAHGVRCWEREKEDKWV